MDAYSGYNQIPLHPIDEEYTSFITNRGRFAVLNRFISKLTDKCLTLFKALKERKRFYWSEKCEEAFQGQKEHLERVPLLSKPRKGEILLLCLAVSSEADRIKGQAVADFVVEFTGAIDFNVKMELTHHPAWTLFVDRFARETGSRAGVLLESPEGHKLNCAIRFGFKTSNNSTEYEALLASLIQDKCMAAYLKKAMKLIPYFDKFELTQIPRVENLHANALSKLVSSKDSELLKIVLVEYLPRSSIAKAEEVMWVKKTPHWMRPITAYLHNNTLPKHKEEASKLRCKAVHFILKDEVLYKRGFSLPLLRCTSGDEANYVLREIHEGICSNHIGGLTLAHKVLRQGYY
ncbi:unnamed protein product [Fraxinus pennsylvanica]|uniref:Uncharacterized protein n=1 Tax=Fraxinus pennsylvanica TaxID=56036 RepID=A0AAD2EFY1_9LAMI|nr:unnamed protein product [Fraxinus pennsylvanica]